MNPSPEQPSEESKVFDATRHETYTLEVISEITGLSSRTILLYQEQGLIRTNDFDDEAVHTLRRIEHLRQTSEANLSGLKLIIDLIDQVERLKAALRARH